MSIQLIKDLAEWLFSDPSPPCVGPKHTIRNDNITIFKYGYIRIRRWIEIVTYTQICSHSRITGDSVLCERPGTPAGRML